MLAKASVMVGCRVAMLIAWGEGLSGRVPHADAKMYRHRGAMESSSVSGPEILGFRRAIPQGSYMRVGPLGI